MPIGDWPPIFVHWLREIPAFVSAFGEAAAKENAEQRHSEEKLLSQRMGIADIPNGSQNDPFRTPRKRKRSVADEKMPKKPRKCQRNRKPLTALDVEEGNPLLDTPTKRKRLIGTGPKPGQRLIMDRIILPTLALYEKERGIAPGSGPPHQWVYPKLRSVEEQSNIRAKWPNSDDTLVEDTPDNTASKGLKACPGSSPSLNIVEIIGARS